MRNQIKEMGELIRKRREILGLLQPQLSAISGISRRTIQLVELGKANPSIDTIIKIANPLGLTIKLTLKQTEISK